MKKMFLSLLLILLMSLSNLEVSAHDFAVKNVDGTTVYYNIVNDTEVAVTYQGSSFSEYSNEYTGSVVIPESVSYNSKNYSVTSIGEYAFRFCTGMTSVTIPNSVTCIGKSAFTYCSGLTSVTIPSSVTKIEEYAFNYVELSRVTILAENPPTLAENTFSTSTSYRLTFCVYNRSLEQYKATAPWSNFKNLINGMHDIAVANADGVTIYYNYKNNKTELAVTYQGSSYSEYPNEYTGNVVIPDSVTYDGKRYPVTCIENFSFHHCENLTSVIIPNTVTSIGNSAFMGCYNLMSVTIPNSVNSIGRWAFLNCYGLKSINIPNSLTRIEVNSFRSCSGLTSITIPNSVTSIGDGAFEGCHGLTSVYIPNSVTNIGREAFGICYGLTSITIPNSVTSIGTQAFSNCSGLTIVNIPNSVTSIENYTFFHCDNLTSVIIPNSVTSIGNGIFSGYCPLNTNPHSELAL